MKGCLEINIMKLAGTSESNFQFSDIQGREVNELNFDSSESDSD